MSSTKLDVRGKSRGLRVAGLFAGIGGLERGFSRAGFETNLLCELDAAAQCVLRERFPGVDIVPDIRDLKRLPTGTDVVCAGFPCQNLSSSGEKAGIRGGKSSLVNHLFRMLKQREVEWVLIENVPFMLQLNAGEAIGSIVSSLENLGYKWAYRVIDSQAFGLPHRRKRVFVVACRNGDPRDVLLSGSSRAAAGRPVRDERALQAPIGFYWTEGRYATGLAYNAIPPLKGGSTIGIPSAPAILFPDGCVGTPEIRDAERLQGFEADWTKPAEDVERPSIRWRLVGNAVTVPVAAWIARRIARPNPYDAVNDRELDKGSPWPNAAWSLGNSRFSSPASDFAIDRPFIGLDCFLRYPVRPLSKRATEGFLRRAESGNLRFPPGFVAALHKYARRRNGH